jgi:hypothetical protein
MTILFEGGLGFWTVDSLSMVRLLEWWEGEVEICWRWVGEEG